MMTCTGFALGFAYLTCTAPEIQVPAARFCALYQPVRYARTDTPETRRRLRALNAQYRAVCP